MCSALPSLRMHLKRTARIRREQRLLMTALVLDILADDANAKYPKGRCHSKTIRRTRKSVPGMWDELGQYARKSYRMSWDTFQLLHETLEEKLIEEFGFKEEGEALYIPNGAIPTLLRLSAALRFFAGGAVYDIMLTHGLSKSSVYKSIYGVVNVVNREKSLSFNHNGAEFPTHDEQRAIASGFHAKSGADFDKIIMTIDGMLIWTIQPSKSECEFLKIGERVFHCYRKDKYGFLLMAGCDHETKFRWADIRHPAACSDYLAWVSSDVGRQLENDDSDLILKDHTIVGDNAFVENHTMATPIPGLSISTLEDDYNFYLSQVRITIERAFGILVHRWGVLRRPLAISVLNVPAFVTCLMRLHNFCIDFDSRRIPSPIRDDEIAIQRMARRSKKTRPKAVTLDKKGSPEDLVGSGHHFRDEPGGSGRRPVPTRRRPNNLTPMRKMMNQVASANLARPTIG